MDKNMSKNKDILRGGLVDKEDYGILGGWGDQLVNFDARKMFLELTPYVEKAGYWWELRENGVFKIWRRK